MFFSEIDITPAVFTFLKNNISLSMSIEDINYLVRKKCGVVDFFNVRKEIDIVLKLEEQQNHDVADSKIEYGDFQTNLPLAKQIVKKLKIAGVAPKVIIEPTCGKGNFIVASLDSFDNINSIIGIEIQEKYVWQTKFNVLDFFLHNNYTRKPDIYIIHSNVFNYDFNSIRKILKQEELLILGNPPWVTNSTLGSIESDNLPRKSNFKDYKGYDAITGKGNFDIAEYITINLIKYFGTCNGHLAFLVKNTVVKNIVFSQMKMRLPIANLQKQSIDCKKEFDVSADASLFVCSLNSLPAHTCLDVDFYSSEKKCDFGWNKDKFMSNLSDLSAHEIDGKSMFVWRQGVKHDCTKVMELSRTADFFTNKLGQTFKIEEDLVYPLLKSSDLKTTVASLSKKYTIITQRYVGEDTSYIENYPLTNKYLHEHIDLFKSRKSKIYNGKCNFSIFGIGDYSFKPYKIAISGLYKTYHFCLIKPQEGKPVMLDDTCYFIGFDDLEQAELIWKILNTNVVSNFLKSISFADSKRMITKELLMRIDFQKLMELNKEEITNITNNKQLELLSNDYQLELF